MKIERNLRLRYKLLMAALCLACVIGLVGVAPAISAPDFVLVDIDIHPGSDPNSINPGSNGVIAVAILGSETFDATTVDPFTVEFGPNGATEAHVKGHYEDVDEDGFLDLVLHFRTQETGIACGDTEATLTGELLDGTPIEGTDDIETVGCP